VGEISEDGSDTNSYGREGEMIQERTILIAEKEAKEVCAS